MDPRFLLILVVVSLSASPILASHIRVMGSVFCDVCYNNSFTKLSYFLPGVDVHVQCKFQANAPASMEQIMFSVNRTTDRYGVYRLDIPSVDGVKCVKAASNHSFCEATLIGSSLVHGCNVSGVSATSKQMTLKSRSTSNLCVYSLTALSYRPLNNKNFTLCANDDLTFNSSKFFLPYYFPWPQFPPLPSLPPFPSLPPLPPFPSLPPLPQFPPLPSLPPFPPFQFPPLSPLPQPPPLPPYPNFPPISRPPYPNLPQPPPLPYPNFPPFSIPPVGDPSNNAPPPPPPPTPFNPSDPRTWIPGNPFLNPPPRFDLRDPRTWIPAFPPSPNTPQSHQP